MWDRISQVVLIIFGFLALVVLTMGLAVSCRQGASDTVTPTPTPTLFGATPIPPGVTATPTPGPIASVDLTATAAAPIPAGSTATPTPQGATPGGPTATPGASATPGATVAPPGTGATPLPLPTPTIGLTPGTTVRHVVNRGEWLLQIGRCYGAPFEGILAANALPNPDLIFPGQVIIVPNVGTVGRIIGPPCVQAYFVQAGDTWESLATRFGTTTAILQRANPGPLSVGRAIWAPRT